MTIYFTITIEATIVYDPEIGTGEMLSKSLKLILVNPPFAAEEGEDE